MPSTAIPPSGRPLRACLTLLRLPILFALLLLSARPVHASHIAGGHLGMRYISPGAYDLSLTMYFDEVHAQPGSRASDSTVVLTLYERGRGNAGLMDTFTLVRRSAQPVAYSNPGCQINALRTLEFYYERRVALDPARYNSPRGYYVVWQRCCRNTVATNVPRDTVTRDGQAQTFYLEFPALSAADGSAFVNSSPTAFQPLRDYACVGRTFRYALGGSDPDGDALVYEVVSPLSYDSADQVGIGPVPAGPAPYPAVQWSTNYDSLHQITGPAPLRVNAQSGELAFTPNQPGLYAFAIRVSEYRQGVRLGEMRLEFQELVVSCALNRPPMVSLTMLAPPRAGTLLPPDQIVQLPALGTGGIRCLNVYVTDADSTTNLSLRLVALDSLASRPSLSVTTGTVNGPGSADTLYSRLCFDGCVLNNDHPARFWLIAQDEGCPRPEPDTVLLAVMEPQQDRQVSAPNIFTPNGDGLNDVFLPAVEVAAAACAASADSRFRRLRVLNRWGREVFSSTDADQGWSGQGCSAGTYYYLLEYESSTYKGWVDLLR